MKYYLTYDHICNKFAKIFFMINNSIHIIKGSNNKDILIDVSFKETVRNNVFCLKQNLNLTINQILHL